MAATSFSLDLPERKSIFARSRADAWLVAIVLVHAIAVGAIVMLDPRGLPSFAAIVFLAVATVYISNTVAHCHLHLPLFASRRLSRALSLALSVTLLVPQTAWKQRHLWHHAGEPRGRRIVHLTPALLGELSAVVAVVSVLAVLSPHVLLCVLLPGFAVGMLLCHLQGRFEHEGDADIATSGVSTYSSIYNRLWFNDGFHAEHHRRPSAHWTELPLYRDPPRCESDRAPLLRALPTVPRILCVLERIVPRSLLLERWIVDVHARAFERLLPRDACRVLVVGGGLFPRTVLVLAQLLPEAEVVIIDASAESLAIARRELEARNVRLPEMVHAAFDPAVHTGFDIVVFPLAFVGDRALVQAARSQNGLVLSHTWLTRRATRSSIVSLFLFKRLVVEGS